MTKAAFTAIQGLVAIALVLPWLNPFASGPTPSVVPWLVSLACSSIFLLLCLSGRIDVFAVTVQTWIAAASISGLIGLLQYFGAAAAFSPWISTPPVGEAFANLRQRNQFATLTNIGLVALLLQSTRSDQASAFGARAVRSAAASVSQSRLIWPVTATVLLATANAASSSRTGMIQLALVASMLLAWGRLREPSGRLLLLVAVLAYALAGFALPRLAGLDPSAIGIVARLQEGGDVCASRLTLWGNVLHLIFQRPWLGWGWGELDYAHFMAQYPGPRFCEILDNAHNLPLHLAVELGLPIATLACSLGVGLIWRARPWRETHPARQMAWAVLAVILLHSMLEYPLWYGPFQIAAGLCVWLLWSTTRNPQTHPVAAEARVEDRHAVAGLPKVAVAASAILLLVCVAYAGWDYHRISQIYMAAHQRSPAYRENTLEKIQGSWLFRNQVRFAEFTITELTPDNAERLNAMAHDLLHFSPEARVAEKLIESASMLGRDDEALLYLARYRAAFPDEHARWANASAMPSGAAPSGN